MYVYLQTILCFSYSCEALLLGRVVAGAQLVAALSCLVVIAVKYRCRQERFTRLEEWGGV